MHPHKNCYFLTSVAKAELNVRKLLNQVNAPTEPYFKLHYLCQEGNTKIFTYYEGDAHRMTY